MRELRFFSCDSFKEEIAKDNNKLVFSDKLGSALPGSILINSFSEFKNNLSMIENNDYCVYLDFEDKGLLCNCMTALFVFDGVVNVNETKVMLPVTLISPPKSGTHFLLTLFESFGYEKGGVLGANLDHGKWYNVHGDSIHSTCCDYFRVKNIRGDFHGGRLCSFNELWSIALFRDPLDVYKSALNYNFDSKNTYFGNFLFNESRRVKLDFLLDSNSVAGDLADVLNDMANWFHFPNVIPISYEELVDHRSVQAVWFIQLLLCIPGKPSSYIKQSYGKGDTFRTGAKGVLDEDVNNRKEDILQSVSYFNKTLGYHLVDSEDSFIKQKRESLAHKIVPSMPLDQSIEIKRSKDFMAVFHNKKIFIFYMKRGEKSSRRSSFITNWFYTEALDLSEVDSLLNTQQSRVNFLGFRLLDSLLKIIGVFH